MRCICVCMWCICVCMRCMRCMPCSVVNFLKIALINPCQMNVKTIIKYIFNLILIYPALSSLTYEIYTTIPSRYFMMSPMDFPLNFKLFWYITPHNDELNHHPHQVPQDILDNVHGDHGVVTNRFPMKF